MEIATRWGETLLDVAHVEADYRLGDQLLVQDGVVVGATRGSVGHVAYEIREITRPARTVPFARAADHRVVPYLAAALLAHVGVWALAATTSPVRERTVQVAPRPRLVARIASSPATAAVTDDHARDRVADTKSQGAGQAANGDAGRAGTRSTKARGHIMVQNTGEVTQLSKAEAVARARRAGVLGQTQVLEQTIANLAGSEKLTSAFDAIDVNAATRGAGDAAGTFGMAMTGTSTGGGGAGWGSVGTGRYGTFSSGTTQGNGWGGSIAPASASWRRWDGGYAPYAHPFRRQIRRSALAICPVGAPCRVTGALDKAIVRRYVRRASAKLESCYLKEYFARPYLRGDVTVSFEVLGDGTVANATAAGVDLAIAACARDVIAKTQLPGSTSATQVTYILRYFVEKSRR